jgi:hypothetical protein
MDRVIALLREKNSYLEKFYRVNEHELINLGEGCFDSVEEFYQARDKILDLIHVIDGLIEEENARMLGAVTALQKAEVESLLASKDELVQNILAQDLQVLTYIEKEKSNIIRDLRSTRQARRAVGAYANVERIKEMDEKI